MKKIGVIYNPYNPAAQKLSHRLQSYLPSLDVSFWMAPSDDDAAIAAEAPGSAFVISAGGDGTILRVARTVAPWSIPILGVNLGKLGFMSELTAGEVEQKLQDVLSGQGWLDERAMLQVEVIPAARDAQPGRSFCALNDVVVGRGAIARLIEVKASIDGDHLTTYKADGVLVCTATGSTGYCLAVGGPILYPQALDMALAPVAPHLSLRQCLVLSSRSTIELEVHTEHQAACSIDGQVEVPLQDQDRVQVRLSPRRTFLLRLSPPGRFYAMLQSRLGGAN